MLLVSPVSAAENETNINQPIYKSGVEQVQVLTGHNVSAQKNMQLLNASYSYTMEPIVDTLESSTVQLRLDLKTNNSSYQIPLVGEIYKYDMPNGDDWLEGPLYGDAHIDGKQYSVVLSFARLSSQPEIRSGVTMAQINGSPEDIITFAFGPDIFPDNITTFTSMGSEQTDIDTSLVQALDAHSTRAITSWGPKTGTLEEDFAITAVMLNSKFDSTSHRVHTQAISYLKDVEEYAKKCNGNAGEGFLYSMNIGIHTDSDRFSVDSVYAYEFDTNKFNTNTSVLPLVLDVLGYFNAPTWTLDSLYKSLTPKIILNDRVSQEKSVEFMFGINNRQAVDDYGLGITFQLGRATNGYGTVTTSAQATYRYFLNIPFSGAISYYLPSNVVEDSKLIYISD